MRGRQRKATLQIIGTGGTSPWTDDPRSSDTEVVARNSWVDANDVGPVRTAVLAELVGTDVPEGFVPLSLGTVTAITRDLQLKRTCSLPGDEPQLLGYLPRDGRYIGGSSTFDQSALIGQEVPPRDHFVWVSLRPLAHPRERQYAQQSRAEELAEVKEIALQDAAEVSRWYIDSAGRAWRSGTDHPEPLPAPVQKALSATVVRRVMRTVKARAESGVPQVVLEDHPTLVFCPDTGECFGYQAPLTPQYFDRRDETWLRVRATSDDPATLDALEQELHALRVEHPSGKVLAPA
jgi:hypothetical protein